MFMAGNFRNFFIFAHSYKIMCRILTIKSDNNDEIFKGVLDRQHS